MIRSDERVEQEVSIDLWFEQHDIDGEDDIVKLDVLVCKLEAIGLIGFISSHHFPIVTGLCEDVPCREYPYTLRQSKAVLGIFRVESFHACSTLDAAHGIDSQVVW